MAVSEPPMLGGRRIYAGFDDGDVIEVYAELVWDPIIRCWCWTTDLPVDINVVVFEDGKRLFQVQRNHFQVGHQIQLEPSLVREALKIGKETP